MKVVRKGEAPVEQGRTFTGKVELERVVSIQREGGMSVSMVHFNDGAVTHWHEHPGEQILVVVEGRGRVGTESESFEVGPGDVVYCPPSERHWHGAASGASMTHASITNVGSPKWFDAPELR